MTEQPIVADPDRERRIACLNVALQALQGAPTDEQKLCGMVGFIYGWTASSADLAAANAKPLESVAHGNPDARSIPGHPAFAVIDGDKPMTPSVRKPAEIQKGAAPILPPSDTN